MPGHTREGGSSLTPLNTSDLQLTDIFIILHACRTYCVAIPLLSLLHPCFGLPRSQEHSSLALVHALLKPDLAPHRIQKGGFRLIVKRVKNGFFPLGCGNQESTVLHLT